MEKMTKRDYFAGLAEIVKANLAEGEGQIYLDFIDRELALLDKRKENAQRRAEKKRAASDDLTEQIFDIIDAASGELVDVEAIMENLDIPDITRNKVAARTTKLVKAGRIEKEPIKVDGKKRMAYRVADAEAVEVADAEAVDVDEVEADE